MPYKYIHVFSSLIFYPPTLHQMMFTLTSLFSRVDSDTDAAPLPLVTLVNTGLYLTELGGLIWLHHKFL